MRIANISINHCANADGVDEVRGLVKAIEDLFEGRRTFRKTNRNLRITITFQDISRKDYEALPEFDGWDCEETE